MALAVAMLVAGGGARLRAQSPAAPPPPPADCRAPEHRQFDFWVGDWDVLDPEGKLAGTNSITLEMDGCALQEHWRAAEGNQIGSSFNVYYPPTKRWYQTWVDSTGGFLLLSGGLEGGKMMLTGEMAGRQGGMVKHRLSFEKTGPEGSRVRQLWLASRDGGKTWSTVFDGTYVKKKGAADAAATPPFARDALDFWLGDWTVTGADGARAGDNHIEKVLGGAAVLEHWTDADGSTGKSFFYFLPAAGRWKQVWVDSAGGIVKEKLSSPVPDGVRFEGKVMLGDGRELPDRTTLTRLPEGRVRQVIEYSKDGGKSWTISFDAVYSRKT
jgi:hypothetical protein